MLIHNWSWKLSELELEKKWIDTEQEKLFKLLKKNIQWFSVYVCIGIRSIRNTRCLDKLRSIYDFCLVYDIQILCEFCVIVDQNRWRNSEEEGKILQNVRFERRSVRGGQATPFKMQPPGKELPPPYNHLKGEGLTIIFW